MRLGLSPWAFDEAGGVGPEPHPAAILGPAEPEDSPHRPLAPLPQPERECLHRTQDEVSRVAISPPEDKWGGGLLLVLVLDLVLVRRDASRE